MSNFEIAKAFYGLTHNPFDKTNRFTVETEDYREMTQRLSSVVTQKGIGLYIGAPGVGKSRIIHEFLSKLNSNLYHICRITEPRVRANEFYRELAIEFQLEPQFRKTQNFKDIRERMEHLVQQNITPIIVIDEAQFLDREVFQEIILLLNFQMDTERRCVLLLSGLPSLSDKLRYATLEPLRQRIISYYHCTGIKANEISLYIDGKFKNAGITQPIFEPNAIEAIASHAKGSLRKIDNLISKSLEIGSSLEQAVIRLDIVEKAKMELLY